MKINFNPKLNPNNLSFTGFEAKKNNVGSQIYEFNFPHDTDKFDCFLEIGHVGLGDDDQYYVIETATNDDNEARIKIDKNGTKVNVQQYGVGKNDPFAYKFILKNKETNEEYAQIDSGLKALGNGEYSLITQVGSNVTKIGSAMLLIPDSYNVGWVYNKEGDPEFKKNLQEKAVKASRTFSNKMGGTLAGMEQKIPYWKEMGISRVFSTPLFTDDSISSHSYWIKNAMQMSQSIGSVDNYASFQKKLFKSGINLVADGAFVNEGLEGVHFKHVLKWGEQSPYYYWFRANGLQAGPLRLGVLSSGKNYISHKVVNSPYKYEQNDKGNISISLNSNYDRKKPTYFQIFDSRLVSDATKKDTKNFIETYDKLNTNDLLDINTHDDTIVPYKFEINPETYKNNVENLKELNSKSSKKIRLDSLEGTRMLSKFENFSLEEKFEGGFETWEANTDIPKINYTMSQSDLKTFKSLSSKEAEVKHAFLKEKNFEAQDYAISAGKYWTKKTKDILLEDTAKALKSLEKSPEKILEKIYTLADNGELPLSVKDKVNEKMIKAAIENSYDLPRTKRVANMNDLLLSGLMDLPLDAIELGDDVVATMATPFMTNRSFRDEEVGVSRYLLNRNGNPQLLEKYEDYYLRTNELYTEKMAPKAEKIMRMVNNNLEHTLFDDFNATTLGKYTLPIVGQDIAKFLIIKALNPESINVKKEADGTSSYSFDYKKTKETTFAKLGLFPKTPEEEIGLLLNKLESKISKLDDADLKPLVDTITKRIQGTNDRGYAVAEMILDATNSGLDWRLDAAKDVSDMDGVRNRSVMFSAAWDEVTNFWGKFTDTVLKENKNSYLVAEVTNIDPSDTTKLLQATGMNSTANYSYFFTTMAEIFGKHFEQGYAIGDRNSKVHKELETFLKSDELKALVSSYTFGGNHDKPRLLHCLAVDMGVFHADFNNNIDARKTAEYVLNKSQSEINFDKLSSKAVAVADVLKHGLEEACDELGMSKSEISNTIANLVQADKTRADGFASKPFEKSLEYIVEKSNIQNQDQKKALLNKAFEKVLTPAMSRFEGLSKFLISMPGIATIFAGDDLAMTGYEEKFKNIYLQNRNALNWDWLNDDNKKFVKEFNARVIETMKLRARAELEPLNTGTPYLLEQQIPTNSPSTPISAILRQKSNGAMTISLLNAAGVTADKSQGVFSTDLKLSGIKLNGMGLGLSAGIKEGTIFKNADSNDKSTYKVVREARDNGRYFDYLLKKEGGDINVSSPTLIFYHQPKKEISFTSSKVLFNPQYNFVSNPYSQGKQEEIGAKLALTCK